MKQVLVRGGQVVVAETPAPTLRPGCVLVDIRYSCISPGTELGGISSAGAPLWRRAMRNPAKVKTALDMARTHGIRHTASVVRNQVSAGTAIGYSAAGIVTAVADDVEGIHPGDEVACAGVGVANHAEVACVPLNLVVPVPPGVSLAQASTVALGGIALQGVRRAEPTLGETVVVIGLGMIGQLTVQLLKATGCRVIASDPDPARQHQAQSVGADAVLDPDGAAAERDASVLTAGVGADAVIITAASVSDEIVSRAFRLCRKKGRVVLVGDVGLNLNREDFYAKELDFRISTSYGPGRYDRTFEEDGLDYPIGYVRWTETRNMEEYLRQVGDGRVVLDEAIGTVFPIDSAAQAYAALGAAGTRPMTALLQYGAVGAERGPVIRSVEHSRQVRSSGRVGLVVIGLGTFARTMHLPTLKTLDGLYEIRGMVSTSGATASELARQYGAAWSTTDVDDALRRPDIDAVLIATNHDSHAALALQALTAGKHVLVEKPLSLDRDGLRSIETFFAGGAEGKPILMTGFNRRFSEAARQAARVLENRRTPMVIDYRVNAGWLDPDSWVFGRRGGGRNLGEACHMYDLFSFLTDSPVSWVQAGCIGPVSAAYHRTDNFVASIGFTDGSVTTLTYTSLGSGNHPKERCEIYCDGRVVSIDDFTSSTVTDDKGVSNLTDAPDKGHKTELETFARTVIDGGDWPIPLWQQAQATEIALRVQEMLQTVVPGPDPV